MKTAIAVIAAGALFVPSARAADFDERAAARFAGLALACVHKEYQNKIAHVLNGDEDVKKPRELTPAFYGCYDWHSSVHGHWLLARLARRFPKSDFAPKARAALAESLTKEKLAGEVAYIEGPGRVSFERPYGLAWLLQLDAELREWDDADARRWAEALAPLAAAASKRLEDWLPKLTRPIRIGEHDQTAFSFGLALDWARATGDRTMEKLLVARGRYYYGKDRACPIDYEPSGQDFLSPCLAEADFMRRVLSRDEFAAWLEPAVVSDPSDPKLAHLDGLNLSRAWMLEGIASALPPGDARLAALARAAKAHREAGLAAVTGAHYEGGHWLGNYAVYLSSERGLTKR